MLAYSRGRTAEAIDDLDHAIHLQDDPSLRANRAVALQDLGEHRRALDDLNIAITELGGEDLLDSHRRGPSFWFQQMDEPRSQRNRIHIDLYVPYDQAEARISAAVTAGGHVVSDAHAPHWWTLADPEGNEVDLAIWG